MRRLPSRKVPPANRVPHDLPPKRRHRLPRPGMASRRHLAIATGSTTAATLSLSIISGYFLIIAALFAIATAILLVSAYRHHSTNHHETRTPMIQDLLRGLFGPQAVPVSNTPPALPDTYEAESASDPASPPPPPAVMASDNPKLPGVAKPVVLDIEQKIARILGTLGATEIGDMTVREMTDLRDVHLPALIESYVDIPADHRARIFAEKGKSASYVLKDSLDVIAERLAEEIGRLAQREISSFDDANRFIADRYGSKKDPFA